MYFLNSAVHIFNMMKENEPEENEPDVSHIYFELQANKGNKFLCFTFFKGNSKNY